MRASSLKAAVEFLQQRYPDSKVGLGGNRQDVENLVERMESVVAAQDFFSIETDRRNPIKTWSADRLLFAKKNPTMADRLIPYPEQSRMNAQGSVFQAGARPGRTPPRLETQGGTFSSARRDQSPLSYLTKN